MGIEAGQFPISPGALDLVRARLQLSRFTLEQVCSHAKWDPDLVALRKELITMLTAAGYSPNQIGAVLNRDHTSILYHLGRRHRKGSV